MLMVLRAFPGQIMSKDGAVGDDGSRLLNKALTVSSGRSEIVLTHA